MQLNCVIFKCIYRYRKELFSNVNVIICSFEGLKKHFCTILIVCFVYCYSNSQSQWTPLHIASSYGHVEVVQLLLTQGAEIDSKDEVSLVKEVNVGVL